MHSCRGCATWPKLYTLQSVREFCLLFISRVLFQTTMWMLSLAPCRFSGTFIKQLEWRYLCGILVDANAMPNFFPFTEGSPRQQEAEVQGSSMNND